MTELSERVSVPVENLLLPDLLRRLVWDWKPLTSTDAAGAIEHELADGGARPWQRELVVPVLTAALTPPQVTDG
jgi:ribonuclease D